jgi:8-oxo-dGTP pyrophosphatase MutT (NUDIX family)
VTPQDIGLVKDVNRANGETQVDIQFRVNTLPWVRWVEGILSRYLKYDVGLPVAVKLDTGRDKEDRLAEAQAWQIYVDSGAASVDEMREELLGLPVDNERRVPRFINTKRLGPVPLTSIEAIAGPVDAESLSPTDAAPLAETPFDGAPALVPDKLPGGQVFTRAQINPDEPSFPGLQVPHPDTGVVAPPAAPVAKDATAGVTSATGITGSPLAGSEEDDEVKVAKAAEVASFRRFAKARARAGRWRDFSFEVHDGVEAHRLNDAGRLEVRKAAGLIGVAGLAVLAADSGRVLMLQRALDPSDDAAGMWEFPGGHLEDGESPLDAARREWQEEVGCLLPAGEVTGVWDGANGIYRGFVYRIGGEGLLDVAGRGQVNNPDDPDGDVVEAIAWWAPALLPGNPALRVELAASIDAVLSALAPVDGEGLEVAKAASGSGPKA